MVQGEEGLGPTPAWSATLALTRDQALRLIQAENFARQVRLMLSICWWSVPQQPPRMVICGCPRRMSRYSLPSATGQYCPYSLMRVIVASRDDGRGAFY